MRKTHRFFYVVASLFFLPFALPIHSRQEPAAPNSGAQASGSERPTPRALDRGAVLMPNDPLLTKMAQRQELSQRQYKSMTFEQKAIVERYNPSNKLGGEERVSKHREIVARYSPDGNGELRTTLISDTGKDEDKGKAKKTKGKEGETNQPAKKSLAEKLISPLLFPMTTDNVQHCKFTVELALPDMALLRFEPEAMTTEPIFAGHVFVNPVTGEIYRLEINALYNFDKIDGRFSHLKEFHVAIDYPGSPEGYRFPTYMQGSGFAKVLWVSGYFRFQVTESGYAITSAKANPAE